MLVQIKDTKGNIVKQVSVTEVDGSILRNYPMGYTIKVVK